MKIYFLRLTFFEFLIVPDFWTFMCFLQLRAIFDEEF